MPYSAEEQQSLAESAGTWCRMHVVDAIPSTQDLCRRLAEAPGRHCVVASTQTEGRGRQGRTWVQSPDEAISLSLVCRPGERYEQLLLPLLGAAAAYELAESVLGASVRIKWPNDILCGPRKLAGILVEAAGEGCWVLGIGVNVLQRQFPAELEGAAGSLASLGAESLDRGSLLCQLVRELRRLFSLAEDGRAGAVVEQFNRGHGLSGRLVELNLAQRKVQGTLREITPAGVFLREGKYELGAVQACRAIDEIS